LISLPPPPAPTDNHSSTSRDTGSARHSVAGHKSSSVTKKINSKKTDRWLAFKERKKAAKLTAQNSSSAPPQPPPPTATTDQSPEVVRSVSSELQVEHPPSSPQQQQQHPQSGDIAAALDGATTGQLPVVYYTANGSSISFGDFQPADLDGIDIDELMLLGPG
jgi:hypothetical protein